MVIKIIEIIIKVVIIIIIIISELRAAAPIVGPKIRRISVIKQNTHPLSYYHMKFLEKGN